MLSLGRPILCAVRLLVSLAVSVFISVAFFTSSCREWLNVALRVLAGCVVWTMFEFGTKDG